MTLTLIRSSTPSDLTGGADFDRALVADVAAGSTLAVVVAASPAVELSHAFSAPGVPGLSQWPTGDWTIKVEVTLAQAALNLITRVRRISADGTVLETSPASTQQNLGTTGVKTFTHTGLAWTPGSTTDRIAIVFAFSNTAPAPRSVTIRENTIDCAITCPLDEEPPVEEGVSTFYLSSIASDLSGGDDFSNKLITTPAAGVLLPVLVDAMAGEVSHAYSEPGAVELAQWPTGDWTVKVEVVAPQSAITLNTRIDRIAEDGTFLEQSPPSAPQNLGDTGVKTFVHPGLSWAAGSTTDRIRVRYGFSNSAIAPRQVTIRTNTTDCSVSTPLEAAVPPTVYLPYAGYDDVSYASSQCPDHPILHYTVFRSNAATPANGKRPWIAWCRNGGTSTSLPTSITTAQKNLHNFLEAGFDVICFMAPVPRGGASPNNESDATFNPAIGAYGDAYRGNGVFYPEDVTNLTSGVHPWLDPAALSGPKGAAMFTQHIATKLTELELDDVETAIGGRSAGAIMIDRVFGGTDCSTMWVVKVDEQDSIDTEGFWKRCILDVYPGAWYPAFDFDGVGPAPDFTPSDFGGFLFPVEGGEYDQPAATMGESALVFRERSSALWTWTRAAVIERNRTAPVYIYSGQLGTWLPPYDTTASDVQLVAHAAGSGRAMRVQFPDGVRFVIADRAAYDPLYDSALLPTDDDIYADQLPFLRGDYDFIADAEPVEELALAAVEDEIREVTLANGYRTDVQLVVRGEEMADELRQYPAVMTFAIDSAYDDSEAHPRVVGRAGLSLQLVMQMRNGVEVRESVSRFIADVRKALQRRLTADSFDGLVQDIHLRRSSRWLNAELTTPICGATLDLEVEFRDRHEDPYTPA